MISEKLRYSLKLEHDYLDEYPKCDNVEVFFPFYETSRSIYYISRFGCSVFRFDKPKKSFKSIKFRRKVSPANLRKSYKAYLDVHVAPNYRPLVHQIVAKLFIDNPNVFATEVDHLNGDVLCNNAFNLEWVTREENIRRRCYNYYKKKNRPIPEKYMSEVNYMSYLNSKKNVIQTKRS